MKKFKGLKKILILSFLMIIPLIFSFQNSAYAYNLFYGNHYMTTGVKGYYYIDSSAEKYKPLIDKAMANWNATSTPVNFKATTDKKKATIEFHYGDFYSWKSGTTGQTYYYKSGKEVYPWQSNWSWSRINLDKGNFDEGGWKTNIGLGSLDEWHQLEVITHEIGHALGLAHDESNHNSIMFKNTNGVKVNKPDTDSVKGINYLYYSCTSLYKK